MVYFSPMTSLRRKSRRRLSRLKQFDADMAKVETDWKFWAMHVLHWHALLLVVLAFLFFGYAFSNH